MSNVQRGRVPSPRDADEAPLTTGALVLHGFTSSFDTVSGLLPHLERAGIPYRMPSLRGHNQASPAALRGVKYRDWIADGAAALADLLTEVDMVVPVGLSMGGLVALTLAQEQPDRLAGVVSVATALRLRDPLAPLSPYIAWMFPRFQAPRPPQDADYVSTNYQWFPGSAGAELYRFGLLVEARLWQVTMPILVIGSERDTVVKPESARIIYDRVSSGAKKLVMLTRTDHEMMQGCEKESVFELIVDFFRTLGT